MKNKPRRFLLYILIRIIGFLLYPLPLKIGLKVGGFFGKTAYYIIPKERKKAIAHLELAFGKEKTHKEIKDIALNVFSNLGKNAVEWFNFPKIDKAWFENNVTAEGVEHIRQAHAKNKGTIILASHFGNWELMAAYLANIGCGGLMIVRRIYIEGLDRLIVKMRKSKGNDVAYRDESPKKVLKVLKNNGYVGIVADQDVKSVEGVFVDFFGTPAYTPIAPVNLAIRTGAAFVPAFLFREGRRYRFIAEKEIHMDVTQDRERDLLVNTIKWTRVLERYIRRYPDQWVWMHRRWKTRPEGELNAVTSEQMQQIDKAAQERFGIPSITLMENAGKAAADVAMDMLNAEWVNESRKRVAVFCGRGNNGGDGLVISRRLIENGFFVKTYLLCEESRLKGDPAANLKLLKDMKADIDILKDISDLPLIRGLSGYGLIIDAIFGTGIKGRPDELSAGVINAINTSGIKVLSVDVPSGLDATTGECASPCVKADDTVTFGLPKTGFYRLDGPKFTGRVIVKNIGFPDQLLVDT